MKAPAVLDRPLRVAIYVRISKDDDAEALGVQRQEAECRAYVAQHYGSDVEILVYCDNNLSAYKKVKRPAFDRLMVALAERRYDVLVCWATDRLYRRLSDLEGIINVIGERGPGAIPVAAVHSGQYDLSTADGRMTARITGTVAQHASEKSAERIESMHRDYAARGWAPPGLPPYGFRRARGADGGPTFVVIPSEAKVIRRIVSLLEGGLTLVQVARDLNDHEIPTRSGGRWTNASVRRAVMSPAIAGKRGHTPRSRGDLAWKQHIAGDAGWKAIIPPHRWSAIEHVLSDPARRHRQASADYWLTGVLVTEDGRKLVGSRHQAKNGDTTRRIYRSKGRPWISVDADEVERVVGSFVRLVGDDVLVPPVDVDEDPEGFEAAARIEAIEAEVEDLARRTSIRDDLDPDYLLPGEAAAKRAALMAERHELAELDRRRKPSLLGVGERLSDRWWDWGPDLRRRAALEVLGGPLTVLPAAPGLSVPDRLVQPESDVEDEAPEAPAA